MPCNHETACGDAAQRHSHAPVSSAKMGLAVGLTLAFVVVEAIAGGIAHSLSLLSDAGHNFADAAALGLSWYALWIAKKPSHARMTFGYHRVGILAALVNAVSLVVIALTIFWEAAGRLHHPDPAHGGIMIAVAAVAVALNFTIGSWLHAGSHHDLNVRAARLHMLGDAISAVGVVIAGIVVAVTGATIADPIVSFLIAGLILPQLMGCAEGIGQSPAGGNTRRYGHGSGREERVSRGRRHRRTRPACVDGRPRRDRRQPARDGRRPIGRLRSAGD